MSFRYLGDIAVADIAFEAAGSTLEEVFTASARATMQVMAGDLDEIRPSEMVQLELEQHSAEMLLFDFLNELIFYKDARQLLLLPREIAVSQSGDEWRLKAELRGEVLDGGRHRLETDVKAVTLHRFTLVHEENSWRATVVLDV